MLSVQKIWTVARYEIKTLLRSWFFRIFATLVILFLTFFNVLFFAQAFEPMEWMMRGVPSFIPYFNILLLNVAQAVIALFLASDFLKRDRKANTTEVIYMRSMSNSDYILGKSAGLLSVFLGLDILFFLIVALIHIIFTDVPFQIFPYAAYLLLVSLPTLIFIFGLSFFIMSLIRNQAVTVILLLGYFAVSLIVLNYKYNAAFDAVAFFLPLAYSDFVGFADLRSILLQRLGYFCLGFGFIWTSILMFKRLPQSRAMTTVARLGAIVFLAAGILLFTAYLGDVRQSRTKRAKMVSLNDAYKHLPTVNVGSYSIDLTHKGNRIHADVEMQLQNTTTESMSEIVFSLNSGLTLESMQWNQNSVSFEREWHLIRFTPLQPLSRGQRATLSLSYSGDIDKDACYLSVPEEKRTQLNDLRLYKLGKEHAFVTPDYVLLTPETNWYPIPGTTHGSSLVNRREKNFAEFQLNVNTAPDLLPVSQGTTTGSAGTFTFTPETPLTQLSLAIGPYVQRSIQVDSVSYHLFTHKDHTMMLEHTQDVADTLESLIRDIRNSYELRLNLDYPFSSFSLVEVPIHFQTFEIPLQLHRETVQPMQVLLPENGVTIDALDFKRHIDRMTDRMQDRNQTMSAIEMQSQAVRRFIESELTNSLPPRPWDPIDDENAYTIFPNYYQFTNQLYSETLPVMDTALEAYYNSKIETSTGGLLRFHDAITDEEQANIELLQHSLQAILSNPENRELANAVLKAKSSALFRLLESKLGAETLESFLKATLNEHRFQELTVEDMNADLEQQFNVSLVDELDPWYEQSQVPGFYFTDFRNYKVLDGNRQRYQVHVSIYNPEPVDGVVVIDFMGMERVRGGGPGRFGFNNSSTDYERVVHLAAGQTKRVSLLVDEAPRAITFNTLVSKNLPAQTVHRFEEFEENTRVQPVEGEEILEQPPVLQFPGEFIVDNEDDGFRVLTSQQQTPLQRLLNVREESTNYVAFRPWWGPNHWRNTLNTIFYGDFVHSAYYIRAGDGEAQVAWVADLTESGQYAVYYYAENFPMRGGRRGRSGFVQDFHFTIRHDDGEEAVEWDSESADGWNYLGTFYFSQGEAKVELSNQSNGRIVLADAVKWVKQ